MKKNLLIMTEMPEYFVSLADQNFNTHKLWKQKDEDNYLFEVREDIEAIAVMGGYKITPDLMKSMPNLKIIACYGVGYDAIDVNFAKSLAIKVTNKHSALISLFSLSSMPLWIQYSRYASPDLPFVLCILLVILFFLKSLDSLEYINQYSNLFFSGLLISTSFFIRSYMVFVPLLGLAPFIIYHLIV